MHPEYLCLREMLNSAAEQVNMTMTHFTARSSHILMWYNQRIDLNMSVGMQVAKRLAHPCTCYITRAMYGMQRV